MKKCTTEEFIKKAIGIHGNRYKYDLTDYINSITAVKIECVKHGYFKQTPVIHISHKSGCPKCGKRLTTNDFVLKSQNIHGNRYNYSKTEYISYKEKVSIICNLHGEFKQLPNSHFKGSGCPTCGGVNKLDKSSFINQSSIIHNNFYDYTSIEIRNCKSKIKIICPHHGKFWQTPNNHLQGQGCPNCKRTISKKEQAFLNYMGIPNTKSNRQVKILNKKIDGYDTNTKTVYEFLGDYWHGNPTKFHAFCINEQCKKSFGQLYIDTVNRLMLLKNNGYIVKYVWESDWDSFVKNNKTPLKIHILNDCI